MNSSVRRGTEGLASWLAIAAVLAVLLVVDAWVVFGGRSPGKVAGSLSETGLVELEGGQRRVFAPASAPAGTVLACVHAGLRVAGRVPAPGRTFRVHLPPPDGPGGATLTIATRADGSVHVRCSS